MERRSYALTAILAALFAGSVGLGMTSPLIGLIMNAAGIPRTLIGLNHAMFALAIILFAPAAPRLMRRYGSAAFLIVCLLTSAVMLLTIHLFRPGWIWFPLRLVMGCGFAGLWVVSESAVNQSAREDRRGLLIGIYATIHTVGFAIGAYLIKDTGIEGPVPFLIAAGSMIVACLPILLVRKLPPPAVEEIRTHIRSFLRQAPFVMAGAFVFGITDIGVVAMLPVYGVRAGLSQADAAFLLVAAQLANPLVQIPLGALADRFNRRSLLLVMAVLSVICAAAIGPAIQAPGLRVAILFVLGGALFAIYSLSLTLLGERFKGTRLAEANAAFVFMYGIGALVGPPLSGLAMDRWDPAGLIGFLGIIATAYLVFGIVSARRRA